MFKNKGKVGIWLTSQSDSMERLITLLICLPFFMAIVMLAIPKQHKRLAGRTMQFFCAVIMALSIWTAYKWYSVGKTLYFDLPATEVFNNIILAGDIILMVLIIYLSFKYNKWVISLLSIIQTIMVVWVELFGAKPEETPHIDIDWLTIVMILIIGVVGVLIGIYAVGYMEGYHKHHIMFHDRRNYFFAVIFIFYGAMFGLVSSMNIIWMDFFWETTSVCSFLLIGYTRTKEAIDNSFRALWMNLLGGLGLATAVVFAVQIEHSVSIKAITTIARDSGSPLLLIPIAMLAFGALTKSAQLPFSQWLLGAMVAPTPSSALLHSATMVKAGVYLLIRISVAMHGNYVGEMVFLIGGFTFFATSLLAITVSDGKKVLAYSTISNLGLITACAGVGTEETVWAAVFLIVFHAVSKSMLFQGVGAVENATGSRNIEDMEGLASTYPKLASILLIGIAGMYIAPFGMLVSKWAALKAFVDSSNTMLVLFLVFGSAATMFYWTKWMAKILGGRKKDVTDVTQKGEYISMFTHAVLLVALCLTFPVLSNVVVVPLMADMFGNTNAVISEGNTLIMIIMVGAIFIVPVISRFFTKLIKSTMTMSYMSGVNAGDDENFVDAFGNEKPMHVSNWYMDDFLGETKLLKPSVLIGAIIIIVSLCLIIGGAL